MYASSVNPRRRAGIALVQWAAAAAALPGCAGYYYGERYGPTPGSWARASSDDANRAAVQRLLRDAPLEPRARVLVRPLTNIDPAAAGARFGRVVAEQLASALAQAGMTIVPEPDSAQKEPTLDALMQARAAPLALVGSYTAATRQVYVSLRLVRVGQGVLAAVAYQVPIDEDVRALLT